MKKYFAPTGFILAVFFLILICGEISIPNYKNLPKNNALASVEQSNNPSASESEKKPITASSSNQTSQTLRVPILIYHSVRPSQPEETESQKKYNVTPDLFEKQLIYLKDNGYTTISLDQLTTEFDKWTIDKTTKPIIITFDDGWQNQYNHAFPLLQKYNYTATFYIYTNPIEKDERFLTWKEIKEMDNAGMTIGSHSVYHPYFSKSTTEQLKKEILNSKKTLEKKLGKTVANFATPFGQTSPQIEAMIQEAGYQTNRLTIKKNSFKKEDLFSLPGYFVPQNINSFINLLTSF